MNDDIDNDDEVDGNDDEVENNDINHLVLHLYNLHKENINVIDLGC